MSNLVNYINKLTAKDMRYICDYLHDRHPKEYGNIHPGSLPFVSLKAFDDLFKRRLAAGDLGCICNRCIALEKFYRLTR